MAQELFVPYRSHLPQHIQDDFDEDEVMILHRDNTFEDLLADGTENRGFTFEELYLFVRNRLIFITSDTAIHAALDAPSHHKYTVDVTFAFFTTNVERTLHISGVDAQKTSPALNFLLRLILESNGKINNKIGMTFKCFSTTPRQQLGSLDLSPLINSGQKRKVSSVTKPFGSLPYTAIDIEFRFLALSREHCNLLFNEYSHIFSSVKLSQCEIDGWTTNERKKDQSTENSAVSSGTKSNRRSTQKLILSCNQNEFRKFLQEWQLLVSNETFIYELDLLLHFMLADKDANRLASIIEESECLQSMKIEFLDIGDKIWGNICEALRNNRTLKRIELSYTEKFADSFRRLTPERRHSRTNDVLQLLNTNKTLQKFSWPKFQQDESLMPNIERLLMENRSKVPPTSTTQKT